MTLPLDCYRALQARDPRFDGQFFVGVKTTRIYCRPICPARTPRQSSCVFYETPAAAENAGFRPCLRCRPELAPGAPSHSLAAALYGAIRQRAITGEGVEEVARHAGYSARQLRRLMVGAFGVTPAEIMQTERLLFAKKLLQETDLPATEVAHGAGFRSLRRFNALFRTRYRQTPTILRRLGRGGAATSPELLTLRLAYRPPLAWGEMIAYLARRALPGVEAVSIAEGRYTRSVKEGAIISVRHAPKGAWLEVSLPAELAEHSWPILSRLRALFDLDANPAVIDQHLRADPKLRGSVRRHPGLRVPGAWSLWEVGMRAILGQQVSVAGATTLAGRLVRRFGEPLPLPHPTLTHRPPSAEAVAAADVGEIAAIGLPRARAASLRAFAATPFAFEPTTTLAQALAALRQVPGLGDWTAQYIAMRGLRFPDAFPASDLGLRQALQGSSAEPWRPWQAYAAMHLWNSLTL